MVEGTEASIDPFEGDNEMVKDGGNGLDLLTEAGIRKQFAETTPLTDVSRGVGTRKERLFERAVYCFAYDDNEMLHQVQDLMKKVNSAALPGEALRPINYPMSKCRQHKMAIWTLYQVSK